MDKTTDLITSVKAAVPSAYIIAGGPHVSTLKESVFTECPSIDYALQGEGEISLFKLLRGDAPEGIAGLLYRDRTGTLHVNQKRITGNIDTLPFPRYTRFQLPLYTDKSIPLLTSRGCPFKCIYCQQSSLLSKNWRGKSAGHLVEEIRYWREKGYSEFQILDDNFAYDVERLKEIHDLFVKHSISDITLNIVGGIRISGMNREKLLLLKDIGVELISFGIESFSDTVLRFIKKGTTTRKIEQVVRMATEMGFKVRLFFIIGFPYETEESVEDAFTFVMKYPLYQVRFFNLVPYEGTELMNWINEEGHLLYCPSQYMDNFKRYQDIPLFDGKHTMGVTERTRALQKARQIADRVYDNFMQREQQQKKTR